MDDAAVMDSYGAFSFSSPIFTVLFWVFFGIIICVCLLRLLHLMYIDQTVDSVKGFIIISLFTILYIGCTKILKTNEMALGLVAILAAITLIIYEVLFRKLAKKELKEQIKLDIQRCVDAIHEDSKNEYAYEKLGDIYRELKDYDKSIVFYKKVMGLTDDKSEQERMKRIIFATEKDREYVKNATKKLLKQNKKD